MRRRKHLPLNRWPEADHEAFRIAYTPGDIFDETSGPGAHLSEGTRKWIRYGYRRWLGFLDANHSADLLMLPADRIARDRVRAAQSAHSATHLKLDGRDTVTVVGREQTRR